MKMKRSIIVALFLGLIVGGSFAAAAESGSPSPYRVLIVDGTKTLVSTMRVVGLAGGIRQSGVADVTVILADDLGPFSDPLPDQPRPEAPFDLILIVPRGIDDATATRIWVLVAGNPRENPLAAQAVELLRAGIDRAFAGIASAVGPLDDLWAALTASYYVLEGWLQ
jgi:voltage-gated potassium channel Kch